MSSRFASTKVPTSRCSIRQTSRSDPIEQWQVCRPQSSLELVSFEHGGARVPGQFASEKPVTDGRRLLDRDHLLGWPAGDVRGDSKQQLAYVPSQRRSGEADPGAEVLAPRTPSQARGHSDVYSTRELAHGYRGCRQDGRPLPRSRRIAGGSNCGHPAIIPTTTDSARVGEASDSAYRRASEPAFQPVRIGTSIFVRTIRVLCMAAMSDVDNYGVPLHIFGDAIAPEFFEILGRLLAVNGKIEYLRDRLDDLPSSETSGVRKVEQFLKRYNSGRLDRNAIVHSYWAFGAHTNDPEVILGIRYKIRKLASGETATVATRDVPGSEREQDVVQYKLDDLRKLLSRDVVTMRMGEIAYADVELNWARRQLLAADGDLPIP